MRTDVIGWSILLAAAAAFGAFIVGQLHWGEALRPAAYAYPATGPECPATTAAAPPPDDSGLPGYTVRTPSNYDPRRAHPLLMVFSPAGSNRALTERFTGLTHDATAQGLIVAYVDSLRLSRDAVARFARVVSAIERQWCIDPRRISFTGHSDGGSVSELIALLDTGIDVAPAAVVASAGGLIDTDFAEFECRRPIDVTLYHGRDDHHFPGYGASAARGWAQCLGCDASPDTDTEGCAVYRNCRGALKYCEQPGGHWRWPDINSAIVAKAAAAVATD